MPLSEIQELICRYAGYTDSLKKINSELSQQVLQSRQSKYEAQARDKRRSTKAIEAPVTADDLSSDAGPAVLTTAHSIPQARNPANAVSKSSSTSSAQPPAAAPAAASAGTRTSNATPQFMAISARAAHQPTALAAAAAISAGVVE